MVIAWEVASRDNGGGSSRVVTGAPVSRTAEQEVAKHYKPPLVWPGSLVWTVTPRSWWRGKAGARAHLAVGQADRRMALGWPASLVRLGSPPLMGILQPWLQPSLDLLPGDLSRAFAPAPERQVDQHPAEGESLHAQQGPVVGQLGHPACHPAIWNSWRVCPC